MPSLARRRSPRTATFSVLALSASLLLARAAHAAGCTSPAGLSACFDANSLWQPSGQARFLSLPDTQGLAAGDLAFALSSELLHQPVQLHAASPDREGRDINVLDYVLDSSLHFAYGVTQALEASFSSQTRLYQNGAGLGGVSSQTSLPVERNGVRSPRLGLAYSLNQTLRVPRFGARLALDAALPLGDQAPFLAERSWVVMPSLTLSGKLSFVHISGSLGARLRSALDVGGTHLGNQGFIALGIGVDVLRQQLLFLSLEAYGFPPLSGSRSPTSNARLSDSLLFPAEWLAGLNSSLGSREWRLGLGVGSGIPLSSETRAGESGASHFLGLGTPDFRAVLVLRYAPNRTRDSALLN